MRYLIVFILLSVRLCYAQENQVLRIVSYHGDVLVDQVSVHSGQLVFSSSAKLDVAKNSYVYVLTVEGHVMKIKSGTYKIEEIEKMIYKERYTTRLKSLTTAIVCKIPYPIVFPGIEEYSGSMPLLGDSIFLQWKLNPRSGEAKNVKPPFRVTFVSMFEDILYKAETNDLFLEIDLKRIASNDMNVLMRINKDDSQPCVIKFMPPESATPILNDIKEIDADTIPKYLLDLVVYDCNDLALDMMFTLHKTATLDTTALPNDLKNYISLLKTKYEM